MPIPGQSLGGVAPSWLLNAWVVTKPTPAEPPVAAASAATETTSNAPRVKRFTTFRNMPSSLLFKAAVPGWSHLSRVRSTDFCSGRRRLTCRKLLFSQRGQRLGKRRVSLTPVDLCQGLCHRLGEGSGVERLRHVVLGAEPECAHS